MAEKPLLHPYDGSRTREHFGGDVPRAEWKTRTYGADRSATVSYRFNSLGFRGEEHRPDAARHIFVSGPSTSFGTGLPEEAAWPQRFKVAYARHHGLDLDDVNLVNFSEGGAGNGHVVRVAVSQCARVKPDLLLVELAPGHFRTEYFSREVLGAEHPVSLGPWMLEADGSIKEEIRDRYPSLVAAIQGLAQLYSDDMGVLNTVKEVLLLQMCCRQLDIPYLICWGFQDHGSPAAKRWSDHLAIGPLLEMVDRTRVFPYSIADRSVDLAADGVHPGVETCRSYADDLWAMYATLI